MNIINFYSLAKVTLCFFKLANGEAKVLAVTVMIANNLIKIEDFIILLYIYILFFTLFLFLFLFYFIFIYLFVYFYKLFKMENIYLYISYIFKKKRKIKLIHSFIRLN